MSQYLEKIGLTGSLFTLLCCLGFGPFIALLSAAGAGFLINDAVLAPLLILFLLMGATGLWISHRRHGHWGPLALHLLSALTVVVFTFVSFVVPVVWVGVAGLFGASGWEFALGKRAVRHGS